jgi:hypothetical protein
MIVRDKHPALAFLALLVILFSNSCAIFSPDGPALIDQVERVHWQALPEEVICPVMGSDSNLCLEPLELVFTWRSGYVEFQGFSCCLDCERYSPACQLAGQTVEFSTGTLPISPRVRVPSHEPVPGLIIWERGSGVPEPLVDWCSGGCNDQNECTTDQCFEGVGCVYEPLDGISCQANLCYEPGTCSSGACLSGDPLDCNDDNECTTDICDPEEYGCLNLEYDHMISNEFDDDCVMVACFAGEIWEDFPANDEVPPQLADDDCELQVCYDGEILTADNPLEPGCENLPDP